jgi:two-component system, OmpR family, response regulator
MMKPIEGQKKRILVVDDKISDTQLVKLSLERTNEYIVKEENDATAAIAAAEAFQPQLILLDVMMPGIDGGELAAVFQAHPALQSVPIVFFTAAITHKEVDAGRGLVGGRPFLAKPIVLTELIACLDQHLKPKAVTVQ